MDLRDLWRPGSALTPRLVLMLAEHLPLDSALRASMRGGHQFRAWTAQTYLLAAAVNLLHAANRQRAGKRAREPIVKPPTERPKGRVVTVAEIKARQQAMQAKTG